MLAATLGDRFLLQGLAGSGAMGTVYRALDRHTGARVALKVVAAESTELRARFAAEAEALASLHHPAIVRFIDYGAGPNGRLFLAMEWLDGEDLATRLERGCLSPKQVADLGKRVAEALAAAHARGIIHRDIKPSNLLLPGGQVDRVKVVDFGIARLGEARRLTPHDALLGTPGYMAPEQARGAKDIDARADLFSLGAVMFECLTGRPPFFGEHTMAVLAKLLLDAPPLVSELCPQAPPELARLIDWMLAKDRAARPQRAGDVVAVLEIISVALDSGGGQTLNPTSEPPGPRSLTGSEQRLVSVVAVRPAWIAAAGEAAAEAAKGIEATRIETLRELCATLEPLGAQIDSLMDGSILATWMSADAPVDQGARAARGALLAHKLIPGATVALASGLSDVSQPRPVGQVLDRAAQLLASPAETAGGVRLDAIALGLLDARFQVAHSAAGFELMGEDDIGQRARMLLGRLTPCVGRDRELRALGEALDECVSESVARAVLVTAPAGIGKSRLRFEFLRALKSRFHGVDVWQARGDPISAGSTFTMLGSAIRRTADVPSGAPLQARRAQLCLRVAQHVPAKERDRVAAFLGELIGAPFPDEHSELLPLARKSAVAMLEQIRRAWADFIAAECAAHPVLLVLEDMHWGDTSSVALLDATLGELSEQPLMVLALGRPEISDVFPKLWASRRKQEIALAGLTRRAATELVVHALGPSIEDSRVAQLVERAEGNAFYLEEMIRAVAEGRGDALPETVPATVQARLDALPSDQRRVLRAASVFGERFWPGGVAALLGGFDETELLDAWLDALVEREIIVRRSKSRFPDEPELSFRHALLCDGAYALLTESDRALGHTLAAEWLEQMGEIDAATLAEHFERGKQPERAVAYHVTAAERALAGSDIQAAIANAERVSVPCAETELWLRRDRVLLEAHWFIGELERADTYADELLTLTSTGERFAAGVAIKMLLAAELGSPDRLTVAIRRLLDAEVTAETAEVLSRVHAILVGVVGMTGPRELAAHHLDCAERLAASSPCDATTQWCLHIARGEWKFVFESDFAAARAIFEASLAWAERTGDSRWGAFSQALLGWTFNMLGDFDRCEEALRRAIATSHRTGQAGLIGRVVLAWTHAFRGRVEEAEAEAKRVIENARGNGYGEGMGRTVLAHVLMQRGDLDAAAREIRKARDLLEMTPLLGTIVVATNAEIALEQGRAREALSLAREALGREEPSRIYPSSEFCARLAEVRALAALGDHDGAREALRATMGHLFARAAMIEDASERETFLRKPPWNDRLLALAAEWLPPLA